MTDITAKDLLAELSAVTSKEAETLAKIPAGPLQNSWHSLVHGAVNRLVVIAGYINLDSKNPDKDSMGKARATAKSAITFIADRLCGHLAELNDDIEKITGTRFDDTQLVVSGVILVRSPERVPELVEMVRMASPAGALCMDAAQALHKTIHYANQRLSEIQRSQGGRGS